MVRACRYISINILLRLLFTSNRLYEYALGVDRQSDTRLALKVKHYYEVLMRSNPTLSRSEVRGHLIGSGLARGLNEGERHGDRWRDYMLFSCDLSLCPTISVMSPISRYNPHTHALCKGHNRALHHYLVHLPWSLLGTWNVRLSTSSTKHHDQKQYWN